MAKRARQEDNDSPTKTSKRRQTSKDSSILPRIMEDMPIDIVLEIFSQLEPQDLLRLIRTSKTLRTVLTGRNTRSVWQQAMLNDPDMLELPEEMNEIQFANLVFSEHCHRCFSGPISEDYILWSFRERICPRCVPTFYENNPTGMYRQHNMGGLMGLHLPDGDLMQLVPSEVHGLHLGQFHNQWMSRRDDIAATRLELDRLKDDQLALARFRRKQEKMVEKLFKFQEAGKKSIGDRKLRWKRELEQREERRYTITMKKLRDLGYDQEVEYLDQKDKRILRQHEFIIEDLLLTDDRWERLKPKWILYLDGKKQERLRREQRTRIKQRLLLMQDALRKYVKENPDEIAPGPADLCNMAKMKAVMVHPDPEAFLTAETFAPVEKHIPLLCQKWCNSKSRYLINLMPLSRNGDIGDESRLLQATTFFRCRDCSEPISYPRILVHGCLTKVRLGSRNRGKEELAVYELFGAEPWNLLNNRVTFDESTSASAKLVIKQAGFHRTASAEALDKTDPWLECVRCLKPEKGRAVFRWRRAVLHDLWHMSQQGNPAVWASLNEIDVEEADEEERLAYATSRYYAPDPNRGPEVFICTKCSKAQSWGALCAHVKTCHDDNDREVQRSDYKFHIDAPMDRNKLPVYISYQPREEDANEPIDLTNAPDVVVIEDSDGEIEVLTHEPKSSRTGPPLDDEVIVIDDD